MKNYKVILYLTILGSITTICVSHTLAAEEDRVKIEKLFTHYYETNYWKSPESVSGKGSTIAVTTTLRQKIENLIKDFKIRSIADAPCGDFNWMKLVNLGTCKYIGMDVVKALIEKNTKLYGNAVRRFKHRNLIEDPIEKTDLILCRDMMVHLTFEQIFAALKNFKKSGSRYLLVTTHPGVKKNEIIQTGNWRKINFELPPFNFPKPIALLDEKSLQPGEQDKHLGLWLLQDLPV